MRTSPSFLARLPVLCLLLPMAFLMPALNSTSHATGEDEELPLPRWTNEELRTFGESGSAGVSPDILLPTVPAHMENVDEFLRGNLRSGPRLDDLPTDLTGELPSRLRPEDMRRFLPDVAGEPQVEVRNAVPLANPSPLLALREVSPEFLQAAADSLRSEYLIDPDIHVPEMAHLQMMRFLEFHAHDARIKLYVLVIDKDQKLPPQASLERIASGSLLKSDSCLLVYPLSEPWRARLFVSKSIYDLTSPKFLSETAQECVTQSMQTSDPHDQLQRYGIQLSTRLFWLQKAIGKDQAQPSSEPLREFVPDAPPAQPVTVAANSDISGMQILYWLIAGALAFFLTRFAWNRSQLCWQQRMHNRVWILPDIEPTSRLGGAFTGGGGAMHRF